MSNEKSSVVQLSPEELKRIERQRQEAERQRRIEAEKARIAREKELRDKQILAKKVAQASAQYDNLKSKFKAVDRLLEKEQNKNSQNAIQLNNLKIDLQSSIANLEVVRKQQAVIETEVSGLLEEIHTNKHKLLEKQKEWQNMLSEAKSMVKQSDKTIENLEKLTNSVNKLTVSLQDSFGEIDVLKETAQQSANEFNALDMNYKQLSAELECLSAKSSLANPAFMYLETMKAMDYYPKFVESENGLKVLFENKEKNKQILLKISEEKNAGNQWLEELDISYGFIEDESHAFWDELQYNLSEKYELEYNDRICNINPPPPPVAEWWRNTNIGKGKTTN